MAYDLIGKGREGREYGSIPGQQFHDVTVEISRDTDVTAEAVRVQIEESSGFRGFRDDDVFERKRFVAFGADLDGAVRKAGRIAAREGYDEDYLPRAISVAVADAEDSIERDLAYS